MIYEIRSYRVDPENVPEFTKRFGDGYVDRAAFSPLTGFWSTEAGPESEVVHIWPYTDHAERLEQRARAAEHPNWPPATGEFVDRMMVELVTPFDFVEHREQGAPGPVFEIRYDYFRVSDLLAAVGSWAPQIKERSAQHSLVLAGMLDFGQTNGVVQLWAYPDEETRVREADNQAAWRPEGGPEPLSTVVKRLEPAAFSPLR